MEAQMNSPQAVLPPLWVKKYPLCLGRMNSPFHAHQMGESGDMEGRIHSPQVVLPPLWVKKYFLCLGRMNSPFHAHLMGPLHAYQMGTGPLNEKGCR